MPLTPLHTLSILWFQLKYPRQVDPAALLISTTLIDLESVAGIILHRPHGVWHSYLGAFLVALLMATVLYIFECRSGQLLPRVFETLHLPFFPPYRFRNISSTVMLGSIIHVALDSFTHKSFPNVLFPFVTSPNPFWFGFEFAWLIYAAVISISVYSLVEWFRWSKEKT